MRYWLFNKEEEMNNTMNHKELLHSDFQIKEVEAVVRRDAFTTNCAPLPTPKKSLGGSGAVDFHTHSYLRASRKELITCFQSLHL